MEIGESAFFRSAKLVGTLKVGPAVKTIGTSAFAYASLAGLDLSNATSLVEMGENAFSGTNLASTLMVGPVVKTIGAFAFANTKLAGLDLSKATSLVSIGEWAFSDTNLAGTRSRTAGQSGAARGGKASAGTEDTSCARSWVGRAAQTSVNGLTTSVTA